jgi:hypothetical protein
MRWDVPRVGLAVAALVGALACGADDAALDAPGPGSGVGLLISAEDGLERTCRAADAISTITLERFDPVDETWIELAQYGDDVCRSGVLPLAGLPAGSHRVRVEATGRIQGVTDVLFARDVDLDIRDDRRTNPEVIVLAPRVAYFRISWVPPVEALDDCVDGWSWGYVIEPELGAGGANPSNPIRASHACEQKSVLVHRPLTTGKYRIEVTLYDDEGLARYERVDTRVLSPGANEYQALLTPIGGLIAVDWLFDLDEMVTRDCAEFGVEAVHVALRATDVERPVFSRTVPCGIARPTTLSTGEGPLRVQADASFRLEVSAEGEHLFRGATEFDMPPGAHEIVVTLSPHGQADISWSLSEDGCTRPVPSGFDVTLRDPADETVVWSRFTPYAQTSTTTAILPYGNYAVTVTAQRSTTTRCQARAMLPIDERWATWPELRVGVQP